MDPTGPVRANWSDSGWKNKVPYLNQEELLAQGEELLKHLASKPVPNEGLRYHLK